MMRKRMCAGLVLAVAFSSARAADVLKDALVGVPEDAIGFLCVGNIRELDGKIKHALSELGVTHSVPPPMRSLSGVLRTFLGMSAGLDEAGPLIAVQMGGDSAESLANRQALLVPASDPKALLEAMSAQQAEGGLWTLTLMGQPFHAAFAEKRVVIARTADVAKSIIESKGGILGKLKEWDLKSLEGLDLVLWADGDRLIKTFKPHIDMITGMVTAGAGDDPSAAKQMESVKRNIDLMVEGTRAAFFGIALGEAGVGLRFGLAAKPGTELARRMNIKPAPGSLLQGLPGGDTLLAVGQVMDPAQTKLGLADLDTYFAMADGEESIDKERLGACRGALEECLLLCTGLRLSLRALPAGPMGMVGAEFVIDTFDGKKWLDQFAKLITEAKRISSDEEFKKFAEVVGCQTDAEELGGTKVHHLKVDLAKLETLEELDEDEVEEIKKVLGGEGLLFRLAAADENKVVICFGGGAERAQGVIEQAKKAEAPLEEQPGIKSVSAQLPKERAVVMYLALDRALHLGNEIAKVLDEEPLPFPVPELNAPIGIASSTSEQGMRGDVFVPMSLIVAAKNAGAVMMSPPQEGGKAPDSAPAEPTPTTQPE